MEAVLIALLLSVSAASGVHLLFTRVALGRRELPNLASLWTRRGAPAESRRGIRRWLDRAGLAELSVRDVAAVAILLFTMGAALAFVVFGGVAPALVTGLFAASFPLAAHRQRARSRRAASADAWPRLIDEIRILTGSVGRSIPQALFEAGRNGPPELRDAFEAAHREWRISTDFERTLRVLKHRLDDPTADVVCETLLTAHEIGGSDLDQRLESLADDRRSELQYRKDARARQAGVRFARRFVLIVPLGMAVAGLSVGNGREAYATPTGQLLVVAALGMVIACWIWAGQIMKLPEAERVFDR
ncbi:MAG: type II secretion system F family protein [Acidimicrobiales bacterium]